MLTLMRVGSVLVSATVLVVWSAVTLGLAPAPTEGAVRVLDAALTWVLGFWLGSSAGSAQKTALLAQAQPQPIGQGAAS